MALFKKDPPPPAATFSDEALETLGAVLRDYGKYAFDIEDMEAPDIQKLCEAWVRHLLVGAPRPGEEDAEASRRDFAGTRRFFTRHRRKESQYVTQGFKDMRQIIWAFIHTLGQEFMEDQQSNREVAETLHALEAAAHGHSIEELKRQALAAVGVVKKSLEEREKRQRAQFEALGAQLRAMREALKEARRELEHDPLTQLFNRSAFDAQLARIVDLSLFSGEPASLLMVDADHFKDVNDTFGHPAGDFALKAIADTCVRTFPRKTDFVARYGGEEFAIILQETSLETAGKLAERLRRQVEELDLAYQDQPIPLTVSIGVAELIPGDTPDSWLRRADEALYRAKQAGRNHVAAASQDTCNA